MSNCLKCHLCRYRNKIVWGEGNLNAPIFIIGEAPGWKEDRSGLPFVGPAGMLLNDILDKYNLSRNIHLYITNVVKCKPYGNRNPDWNEILACRPYLEDQLKTIKPKIILLLGNTAISTFFWNTDLRVGKIQGRWIVVGNYVVMPSYHPAAALPHRSPTLTINIEICIKKVAELYKKYINNEHNW